MKRVLIVGIIGATLIGTIAVFDPIAILSVVKAIRFAVKAPGDWLYAFMNWWGSDFVAAFILIFVCSALSLVNTPKEEMDRDGNRRFMTGLIVYAIGLDLWFGQFGIEGVLGKAWGDPLPPLWVVSVPALLATIFTLTLWQWIGSLPPAGRRLIFGVVGFLAVGIWIWPMTIGYIVVLPGMIAVGLAGFVLKELGFHQSPLRAANLLLEGDTPPPEAPQPERGPHAPTEHRSI